MRIRMACACVIVLLASLSSVHAGDRVGIGFKAGSLGPGVDLTGRITNWFSIRGSDSTADVTQSGEVSGIESGGDVAVPPASPQDPSGSAADVPQSPRPDAPPAPLEPAGTPADDEVKWVPAPLCPYCRVPLPAADFCGHCGRFSPDSPDPSGRRFWADVPYVLTFPPQGNAPEVRSETEGGRWAGESVRYASGDRYEMRQKKERAEIAGWVGGMQGGKESEFEAEMVDAFDIAGRLRSRQVTGRLKSDSDLYLYRKLDYHYDDDGRLERIEFLTSFYRGSSDWKKSPAAWLRHSAGEMVLRREPQGTPARIETTVREGKRSLRGEPEYAEPRLRVEMVTRDGERITGIAPPQPQGDTR